MTSPRHPRSLLRTALRWAVVVYAGLGPVPLHAQIPPGVASSPPAPAAQAPPAVPAQAPASPGAAGQAALALVPAWTTRLPGPPAAPLALDGDRLFVALRDGTLLALALESGDIAWEAKLPPGAQVVAGNGLVFAASPPLVAALDPGLVFTMHPAALVALDAERGTERWRQALRARPTAPPVWDTGWLLVGTADGRATMRRAVEGTTIWEQDLNAPLRPGASMTGDRVYVMLEDGRVLALALDRGRRIWERQLSEPATALRPLDDRVYAGGEDRSLYCLSAEDGKVKWRWRAGGAIIGTPAIDADAVYFLSLDNVLRALNRGNGHQRWKRGLSFRPIGGPLLAGQFLLVPGLSPEIAAFHAGSGAPAGKIVAPEEVAATPILLPAAEDAPGTTSLIVVTGESVQRLGPAPPVLQTRPIPGVPLFLPLWGG